MNKLPLVFVTLIICSCAAGKPKAGVRFSAKPYGETSKAIRVDKQKGDGLEGKVTKANFKEVTIAQGAGRDGFDAIRVFAGGKFYAIFSKVFTGPWQQNEKVELVLSDDELTGLIAALNQDKVSEIEGLYSAGWHDGTQGFIEIKTSKGRRYTWLDNHFDPVSHTFDYCNRVIWPKIEGAKPVKKGIDRQAEYDRVFDPESKDK